MKVVQLSHKVLRLGFYIICGFVIIQSFLNMYLEYQDDSEVPVRLKRLMIQQAPKKVADHNKIVDSENYKPVKDEVNIAEGEIDNERIDIEKRRAKSKLRMDLQEKDVGANNNSDDTDQENDTVTYDKELNKQLNNNFEGILGLKTDFALDTNGNATSYVGLIDWVNYTFLAIEQARTGPGEQGVPLILIDEADLAAAKKVIEEYSHSGIVSDKISLDRAVPDARSEGCKALRYRADLPAVSVIIIFHNEYLSNLLRTVHSVINRTPEKLLAEVLLVDDCSDKDFLKKDLEDHVRTYYPDKVRIIRLPERLGLMKTRMEGIRHAKSDIVVVMDGHIEVATGWLPPLIQPVFEDHRVITEPLLRCLRWDTLAFPSTYSQGSREGFDWGFTLRLFTPKFRPNEPEWANFEDPLMPGGFVVMNKTFFWELGGYDDQMRVWGGEQYDLGFKVWMCGGGRLLVVPCSLIGHNYKGGGHHPFYKDNKTDPYLHTNLKRVVEVYFDEDYKKHFYEINPGYLNLTEGDLTKQLALKERLKCKSFQWYLDNVFPEFLQIWPMNVTKIAEGPIQSVAYPDHCIDRRNAEIGFGLYKCSPKNENQMFAYTPLREIRAGRWSFHCIDVYDDPNAPNRSMHTSQCHLHGGNQMITYDQSTQQIKSGKECLDFTVENKEKYEFSSLYFTKCSESNTQKWSWTYLNQDLYNSLQGAT